MDKLKQYGFVCLILFIKIIIGQYNNYLIMMQIYIYCVCIYYKYKYRLSYLNQGLKTFFVYLLSLSRWLPAG